MTLYKSILEFPHRNGTAVKFYENGNLTALDWVQYYNEIKKVTSALKGLGVGPGVRVAIKAPTCLKWGLLDLGIQSLGGVTVPIYPNSTPDEIRHILTDSESSYLFLQQEAQAFVLEEVPSLKKIISMHESNNEKSNLLYWNQFIDLNSLSESTEGWFENLTPPTPDELATLIYTSGTTGSPKGVCLSSVQIHSEITEAFSWGISKSDTTLCFLPFAHVLGRVEFWAHVYWGYTLAFAESIEKLRENLQDIKPTVFIAVPRVFEKFYDAILTQMEGLGLKRKLFDWALEIGSQVSQYTIARRKVPLDLALKFQVADQLIFSRIKQAFGGRLRFAISGGAPLPIEVAHFFHTCGVLILEGYGLTETTAAIAVNRPTQFIFGTVGLPVGDVKIKIADDGEILVKSNKVMMGYHNLPEETAKVLQDGWFATGDIGEVLPTGELRITDRKKDLIKTSGGKYVAPQKIENLLKEHRFIANALVYGDQKKYVVVLLQLNTDSTTGISEHDIDEQIRSHVAEVNSKLASFETVKKFTTVTDSWTVENGFLTPSLKLKRKVLISEYKDLLEAMY